MYTPASRRAALAILATTALLCALAPMNGLSFALVALTAGGLRQLPLRLRIYVMALSLGIAAIGTVELVTNGSRIVTVDQPQTPGLP